MVSKTQLITLLLSLGLFSFTFAEIRVPNRSSVGRGTGITIGQGRNAATSKGTGRNALRNPNRGQGLSIGRSRYTSTHGPPSQFHSSTSSANRSVSVGLIVPFSIYHKRGYEQAVGNLMLALQKGKMKYKFLQKYKFTGAEVFTIMITVTPSPRGEWLFPLSIRVWNHEA